jgi:hypothetical protein
VTFAGKGLGYDLVLVFVDDVADAVGFEHADGDAVNLESGDAVADLAETSMQTNGCQPEGWRYTCEVQNLRPRLPT